MTCLQINEFVKLGGDQLVPYYADILGAILPCIADKEEKIRVVSQWRSIRFFTFHFHKGIDPISLCVWSLPGVLVYLCATSVTANFS